MNFFETFYVWLLVFAAVCDILHCCGCCVRHFDDNDDDDDDDDDAGYDDDDNDDDDGHDGGGNTGNHGHGDGMERRGEEVAGLTVEELKKIMEFTYTDGVWDEGECVICFEKMETGERCRFLQGCGHIFHQECADTWLRNKATCPLCRAVVVAKSVGIEQMV